MLVPYLLVLEISGELLVHPVVEVSSHVAAEVLGVHEVAEATAVAVAFLVLAALGFAEVGNGRVLCLDQLVGVVSAVESAHGTLCLLFILEFDIHIAYHVVSYVVCYDHFF